MRPTDKVLEEEVFLHLFSGATDGQGFGRRSFFCIYLAVRPTDKVLEEEVFFWIYLVVRPTDKVLEEEGFFLDLFSGATEGQGFGRRSFFAFI